ncbi:MAG: N-6 DNA methylase [Planctomycetota bacterium]
MLARHILHQPTPSDEASRSKAFEVCASPDAEALLRSVAQHATYGELGSDPLGTLYEAVLERAPGRTRSKGRRATGSYYTPAAIVEHVLQRTLDPIIDERVDCATEHAHAAGECVRAARADAILRISVCDPACGTGRFLVAAAYRLASHLARARVGERSPTHDESRYALRDVLRTCVFGVDADPVAVELCRLSLAMRVPTRDANLPELAHRIRLGNALLGVTPSLTIDRIPDRAFRPLEHDAPDDARAQRMQNRRERTGAPRVDRPPSRTREHERVRDDAWCAAFFIRGDDAITDAAYRHIERTPDRLRATIDTCAREHRFFHWQFAFPEVFDADDGVRGFDAIVGNPPWIAHAGRASQPLPLGVRHLLEEINPAFAGYRTTHGCFVARAASLLRAGGMLGLVLPTSVADLDGYEPTRRAHDAHCQVTQPIRAFGARAFDGVFQPCMALVSQSIPGGAPRPGQEWTIEREDLGARERALLDRLCALPNLPPESFGERGVQTDPSLRGNLRTEHSTGLLPLRDGESVRAFRLRPCTTWIAREDLERIGMGEERFKRVPVVLRQTARYPIAALHDGVPFRNSLLAAFPRSPWTPLALVAYLNALPIRWFHFNRFRDAREGMPQVKIGHLRALPVPPTLSQESIETLASHARRLAELKRDPTDRERAPLDTFVSDLLGLCDEDLERMRAWWASRPA